MRTKVPIYSHRIVSHYYVKASVIDERTPRERAKYHQESLKIAKFVLYESGFERLDG